MTWLALWPERYAVAPTSAPHNFRFSVGLAPAVLGVLAGKHIGHDFISLHLALLSHAGCHGLFLSVSVVLLRFSFRRRSWTSTSRSSFVACLTKRQTR